MKTLLDKIKDSEDKLVFIHSSGELLIVNVHNDISEVEVSKNLMLKIMDMTFTEIMEDAEFLSVL